MQADWAAAYHALGRAPGILLVLSFEAGLATGLSHFPAPASAALLLGVLCVASAKHALAWLPCASAIGFFFGLATRAESRHDCAAVLSAGVVKITVQLQEPVSSGVASARPSGCGGEIAIRVRGEDVLPAGSRWRVTGRWIPSIRFGGRPAGILVAPEIRRKQPVEGQQPRRQARGGEGNSDEEAPTEHGISAARP